MSPPKQNEESGKDEGNATKILETRTEWVIDWKGKFTWSFCKFLLPQLIALIFFKRGNLVEVIYIYRMTGLGVYLEELIYDLFRLILWYKQMCNYENNLELVWN